MAAVSRAEKSNWSRKKSSVASPLPSGLGWVSGRSVLNCSHLPLYSDTQSARPYWNLISRGRIASQSASPYLLVKQSYIIPTLAAVSDPKLFCSVVNSTATLPAYAHRSALDFPDSFSDLV